jgi:GNAT superfamily N-acetyltransferase
VRFRLATSQDKEYVLSFCKDTFSWGDYIDRVWDIWINESNSILLVAEIENHNIKKEEKKPIAIAHGILIPEKTIWIEGIRVNPKYRKQKLATNLINHILDYGRKREAVYSAAIVSISNEASKEVMKKSGFKVLSKWSYISTDQMVLVPKSNLIGTFKIADSNDYQQIINFLRNSKIFNESGKKFVKSWRWYDLTDDRLFTMICNKQVIIVGDNDNDDDKDDDNNNDKDKLQTIRGIAIIDREEYWNYQNIFQIVYIDADSKDLLLSLINKSLELAIKNNEKSSSKKNQNKYERIQIFIPIREYNSRIFTKSDSISYSEQFLLYYKRI